MQTVKDTLKAGTRIATLIATGRRTHAALTADEQRQLSFSETYAQANADAIARLTALAMHHIAGGGTITTITTVEGQDGKITTTTKTQTVGPDAAMLRWWMERRWPLVFGPDAPEHTPVADGFTMDPDDDDRLALILERAREAAAVAPADALDVIDTTTV